MSTTLDIRQSETRILQDQLNSAVVTKMDSTLASINNELTPPGRLIAASTPDLVVTIGSGTVTNPNTLKNRVLPFINNAPVAFAGGSITFPSTSGTIVVSPGINGTITIGASQFVAVLVQLNSSGDLSLVVGNAASSLGAVVIPSGSTTLLSLGYIIVESNGSSVIQPITDSMLYQFVGGGGGGGAGSGSGTGDDLDSLEFRASFTDLLSDAPTSAVTSLAETNGTYLAAFSIYQLNYDASKTISGTGTSITISAAPSFTIAVNDVIVNNVTGEVKKITAVGSQTSVTIESAFAANPAGVAATISQAFITKDIYNFVVDGNSIAQAFPSDPFSEIMVDYQDNSTPNSNLFAIDTPAVIGYSASNDNATFTTAQSRPTLETDEVFSVVLPSPGTSLYLRFFSIETSGSGIVNLLKYKAFMQKLTVSSAGGIVNSAYATMDGSTTPVNCTLSVVGGKSVITFPFQYPNGVNVGSVYGSLDVYLNGQIIPRYISSSVTPEASYTEYAPNAIQLDQDYSTYSVSIEVLQRVAVVDSNSQNTNSVSSLQSAFISGFQSFVDTSKFLSPTTGSPGVGSFYSTIPNRAPLIDLTQDLKPRFGIQRLMTQQLFNIQTEQGPSGEQVYGVTNDPFGQIRLIGQFWVSSYGSSGSAIVTTLNTTDYCEITFYGTGLNCLSILNAAPRDYRVSVDGGSETNPVNNTFSTVLDGRDTNSNQVSNLVKGLSLGVHTVKIRNNSNPDGLGFYGFEILNESSSMIVPPGVSYTQGQKLVNSSISSFSPTVIATGTTGGRVLIYQNPDGSIGQAFNACATSPSFIGSVNHSNEQMFRQYYWREFGASASGLQDFSVGSGNFDAAFTLDDGTTTLVGNNVKRTDDNGAPYPDILQTTTTGSFIDLTFIGTGIDVIIANINTTITSTMSFFIDGVLAGTTSSIPGNGQTYQIASGLPYGTHVLSMQDGAHAQAFSITGFKIYQPALPALPRGAIALGDYNVVANYIVNTQFANAAYPSQGIIRKMCSREFTYFGTGWLAASIDGSHKASGWNFYTTANGDSMSYTFFGTGMELNFSSYNGAATATATMDGSSDFSGYTTNLYAGSGASFTASTGVLNQSTASGESGNKLSIQGLALGVHTFTLTSNSGGNMYCDAIDVITPIYSPVSLSNFAQQNQLSIGSNALSDDRLFTPLKPENPVQKNYGEAILAGGNYLTTTSTQFVPVPGLSINLPCKGGLVEILYAISIANISGGSDTGTTQIFVDGYPVGEALISGFSADGTNVNSDSAIVYLSPGVHQIMLFWFAGGAGIENAATYAHMTAKEL